jgi:malate dehydrogenase
MKVTIVGAGNVGAVTAQRIFGFELAQEVVLVDVVDGIAPGKALDMFQSGPLVGSDSRLVGTSNYADTVGSDIVVITAGLSRRPGMTRDDLMAKNASIVRDVTRQIVQYSPDCILIAVSSPLDEMTWVVLEASGFERHRVIGMAGVLDSARLRTFIAHELDVSVEDVSGIVLGSHNNMVPLIRYATVAGIPVSQWMSEEKIAAIVARTKDAGTEIVNLLKTVSAFYAPSAAIASTIEAIARDKRRILPCAVRLDGEYGQNNVVMGVPVKLGRRGVEKIVEIDLIEDEYTLFQQAAQAVRENIAKLS